MKRAEKNRSNKPCTQDNMAKLQAIKPGQDKSPTVFIIDKAPKGWFGGDIAYIPIKATY